MSGSQKGSGRPARQELAGPGTFCFWVVLGTAALATFALAPMGWGEYQPKGKRDPFVPLITDDGRRIHPPGLDDEAQLASAGLNLQGIVLGEGEDSFAIINDRVLREQEELDGIKVVKIQPNHVIILMDGQEVELTVHQPTEETSNP